MFKIIIPYLIFWFILTCTLCTIWLIFFKLLFGVPMELGSGIMLGALTSIPILLMGEIEVKKLNK
tara:strand:+ start:511 stop:705 length:195 start_codon:yes stop_codon:yes gene_type:complete